MVMVMRSISSCLTLSQTPPPPPPPPPRPRASDHLSTKKQCKRNSRNYCITRPQILPPPPLSRDALGFRVFVLSDLHTDYPENMNWVKSLSTKAYKNDLLLLAGDVAETYHNFYSTMFLLKDRFQHVFYVPGNHDLWCRSEPEGHPYYLDSLDKLNKLLDACRGLGVQTRPMVLYGLGIVPLFSWYHESFDREMDIAGIRIPSLEMACKDFHACKWPREISNRSTSLASYFDAMNEENEDAVKLIKNTCTQIITFSHFLPRQELCPEKRMLFYPNLPKIIGSDFLEVRIRSIHGSEGNASACHVFGHTHFCWDSVLDGIRYIQAPLAYPRERKRRMNGGETWLPFCVYSGGKFADRLSPCYWSDYYAAHPRAPHVTELAPWVARFYNRA
ncbi:hypothetical protein H0E87_027670 [Populus deltoides]|uniref:Calcineurin-like phosphoesterase domain-containing protein n=1 Tax=Populus deltoides TaxID=3696 RepID=A0A8T2WTE6_POPDE|nr:hypothetical protein H0E87_027670 [Populus deltoides]